MLPSTMIRLEGERNRALHMRALRRKALYRPGPCKQALHKRHCLRLPSRLLNMNVLMLENDLMKDGQIMKKKC